MNEDRFLRAVLAVRNGLAAIVEELNTILGEMGPRPPTTAAAKATMHVRDRDGNLYARILHGPGETVILPVESLQIEASDPALERFLIPRILEAFKEKHGVEYSIGEREGLLKEIRLKGRLEEKQLKDLVKALEWTFEKASERK